MTAPQRDERYAPGTKVYVEGVITDFNWQQPFGELTVSFPTATDPARLLDGVDVVVPQVIVHIPGTHTFDLEHYTATEGYYE